jgi:hypothetical protein
MPSLNASLFKNDRKERDNQPDFTGPGAVTKEDLLAICDQVTKGEVNFDDDGRVRLRVAGWKRSSTSTGKVFISLSISPDDYKVQKAVPAQAQTEDDLF